MNRKIQTLLTFIEFKNNIHRTISCKKTRSTPLLVQLVSIFHGNLFSGVTKKTKSIAVIDVDTLSKTYKQSLAKVSIL